MSIMDVISDAESLPMFIYLIMFLGVVFFMAKLLFKRDVSLKYTPKLTELRTRETVAYLCSLIDLPMLTIISSNEYEISLWSVSGHELKKLDSFPKSSVKIEKGRVKITEFRSVDGLVILRNDNGRMEVMEVNMLPDKPNIIFSPLKGANLDEAILHMQNGF